MSDLHAADSGKLPASSPVRPMHITTHNPNLVALTRAILRARQIEDELAGRRMRDQELCSPKGFAAFDGYLYELTTEVATRAPDTDVPAGTDWWQVADSLWPMLRELDVPPETQPAFARYAGDRLTVDAARTLMIAQRSLAGGAMLWPRRMDVALQRHRHALEASARRYLSSVGGHIPIYVSEYPGGVGIGLAGYLGEPPGGQWLVLSYGSPEIAGVA